jgi:hypothetical protein
MLIHTLDGHDVSSDDVITADVEKISEDPYTYTISIITNDGKYTLYKVTFARDYSEKQCIKYITTDLKSFHISKKKIYIH